ncbi:hypothetical protein VH567_16390 [Sphingomonas sp. 4RDLI-65]|uniref:hypothetical protein n=1 Tax=Sphingomonas sp. 4RDLI-65 TaxID=3111641 RepID=UPI003C1BFFEC
MIAPVSITTPLDPATLTMVEGIARYRGITEEEFAAEAIRKAAEYHTEMRAFIQAGIDDIDAGRSYTQEEVEAWFEARNRDIAAE